jgi:hypothetical protein
MDGKWSSDLSYAYYRRMLDCLVSDYDTILMRDAPNSVDRGRPRAIVRHDVDVSPRLALAMAEMEAERGLKATYMVLVNSPLYSLDEPATRGALARTGAMGHEIALHFDLSEDYRRTGCSTEVIEQEIAAAANQLASAVGLPVESVSFHRPIASFIRGPLRVAGLVNAYAAELMHWYLSDSDGSWREGEPLAQLARPRPSLLQLLVHPIWWGEEHMASDERLTAFIRDESRGRPEGFEKALERTIFTAIGLRPMQTAGK